MLRAAKDLPPGSVSIANPYDTEARYSIKRGMAWRGYKAHFTETATPDRPRLIVHVETTTASRADVETTAERHRTLTAAGLKPDEELVDAAYVSVDHVITAANNGITLTGPLPPDSGWQARDPDAFDLRDFTIAFDNRHVTCPNGKQSRGHRRVEGALCAAGRCREHHGPDVQPLRCPPGPLPRARPHSPPACADRDRPQPRPHRRLARRHPTRRSFDLAPHPSPRRVRGSYVNWPAGSIKGKLQRCTSSGRGVRMLYCATCSSGSG